jgi:phospholipase/carboxylesterase
MAGFVTRLFSRSTNGRGKRKAAKAAAPAPVQEPAQEPTAAERLKVCRWGPEGGGGADLLMVLCHGMGSNGENIIQLAPKFGRLLPRALFVAPSGPEAAPRGGDGHAWFDARDRAPAALAVGVRGAAAALDATIDFELERAGLARDAYALAGYSQGAMTALFAGLRRDPGPRAIFCYAGALIAPETLEGELKNRAPVMLAHGLADPVVPAFYSRDAERALRAAGVPVQGVYLPGSGHIMDGAALKAGSEFFGRWLLAEAPRRAAPGAAPGTAPRRRFFADG